MDCTRAPDAAAYVLGALNAEEIAGFQAHLERCPACRDEVASLQVAVDVLPAAVATVDPPPELKRRIMDVVEAEAEVLHAAGPQADRPPRRRRRSLLPTLAAACVLLVAGLGVGIALTTGGGDTQTISADVAGTARGATAELEVDGDNGHLVMSGMPAPPEGRIYQVWLQRPGQDPEPTDALFTPNDAGSSNVDVPGSLDGVERVMVTDEPRGGSKAPTRVPVVVATL